MGTTVSGGATLLLAVILSILTPAPLLAAESNPLGLEQILAVSLQNNGELVSLREEKAVREAGKIRAGLLPNPTLDLELGSGALTGSPKESSLSIGISQELLLAGKREKRLVVAGQEQELYRWQLADRSRLLTEELKLAFYETLLAGQRLKLTEHSIKLSRKLFEVTKERLAAGDIPELEMNLAKVELIRSEGSRIEMERLELQAKARLASLMGLPSDESMEIKGTMDREPAPDRNLVDLKRLAVENRPDLKGLEAEMARGISAVALAEAEAVPNLTAGLALRRDATSIEVGGMEGRDTAYSIGLKLVLPIPLFDRNQAGIQEARGRKNSVESRLSAARRGLEREVATAYASFQNAGKVLSLYKTEIIPQLEENLALTQEAYRLGEVGILSVIQEQKKYFEVSDGYLTALHARQLALVKLESAVATELTGGVK